MRRLLRQRERRPCTTAPFTTSSSAQRSILKMNTHGGASELGKLTASNVLSHSLPRGRVQAPFVSNPFLLDAHAKSRVRCCCYVVFSFSWCNPFLSKLTTPHAVFSVVLSDSARRCKASDEPGGSEGNSTSVVDVHPLRSGRPSALLHPDRL